MNRQKWTEEQRNAAMLEMRLASDPRVTARRKDYEAKVRTAFEHARGMSKDAIIAALVSHNPAYIRAYLETEDERFGENSLAQRYARTFYSKFTPPAEDTP